MLLFSHNNLKATLCEEGKKCRLANPFEWWSHACNAWFLTINDFDNICISRYHYSWDPHPAILNLSTSHWDALLYMVRHMGMAHSNTAAQLSSALQCVPSALHHMAVHFSRECRQKTGRCPHAGLVPESCFSSDRRKLMYSMSGAACSQHEDLRYSHSSSSSNCCLTHWNRNYREQPCVVMLRHLNFPKVFFQDQIWEEIKDYWGVFLCMLISIGCYKELIFCSFLRTGMLEGR